MKNLRFVYNNCFIVCNSFSLAAAYEVWPAWNVANMKNTGCMSVLNSLG